MTLEDIKKKTYSLIEELNDGETDLTKDPDLALKMNYVINQVQNEIARMKKIPAYVEIEVAENELIDFESINNATSNVVYQIDVVRGVEYESKADGTILKALEAGTMEIEYYKYPKQINNTTEDTEELDLPIDCLEILPYGVAADLLKSDVSNNYGQIYAQRYETMIQRLDPRYNMGSIYIEGGVDV